MSFMQLHVSQLEEIKVCVTSAEESFRRISNRYKYKCIAM